MKCVCVYIYICIHTHTHIHKCCAKLLQLCLTLCDPMNHSPPGSSVHGFSRLDFHALLQGIFPTQGSNLSLLCLLTLAGRFFTTSAAWEVYTHTHTHAQRKAYMCLKHNLVYMGNSEGIKDCWEFLWEVHIVNEALMPNFFFNLNVFILIGG